MLWVYELLATNSECLSSHEREGRALVGLQNSVCSWQARRRVLGWCMTFDLPDLNPRPAAGLDPQLCEKEWDKMINSFGLVMPWNISICMIVNYKQEYQCTHEKYRLDTTKSISFKGKTPRDFRSAHSRTWPPHFLSQPLGCCIHKIISWCRMGMEFLVFTKRLALPQTDTTLLCLVWIMNLELKCC